MIKNRKERLWRCQCTNAFSKFCLSLCCCLLHLFNTAHRHQFFLYPDDKIYGPEPWSAESVEFTLRTVLICKAGLSLLRRALLKRHCYHYSCSRQCRKYVRPLPLVSWLPERNFNVFMFDYRGLVNQKARRPRPDCWTIRKVHQCGAPSQ